MLAGRSGGSFPCGVLSGHSSWCSSSLSWRITRWIAVATCVVGPGGCPYLYSGRFCEAGLTPWAGWLLMVAAVWMVVAAMAFAATSALRNNVALNGGPFLRSSPPRAYPVMAMGVGGVVTIDAPSSSSGRGGCRDDGTSGFPPCSGAFAIEERIDAQALTVLGTAAFAIGNLAGLQSRGAACSRRWHARASPQTLDTRRVRHPGFSGCRCCLPLLSTAFPRGGEVSRVFWGLFAIAVGAAGLHPALAHARFAGEPVT